MNRPLLFCLFFLTTLAHGLSLPPDAEIQKRLAAHLGEKGDFQDRVFRRLGDRTVEFEGFISTEADFNLVKEVFSEPQHYSRWLMKNINKRPGGGEYFIKLRSFDPAAGMANTLLAVLNFELPLFKKVLECHVHFKSENKGPTYLLTATVDTKGHGTFIEKFETVMQFFPKAAGRVWIYARGQVKFKHWLLYEALPERMLLRESGERLQIVIDNYLTEENLRRGELKKTRNTSVK